MRWHAKEMFSSPFPHAHIIGVIPARFESSRFRGKPLALISGKSLIQRTYENAKRFKELKEIIVATDDMRISEHVKSFGGNVIMTSPNHATGTDRLAEVISKYSDFDSIDLVFNIQGDEPCLEPSVVSAVITALIEDSSAVMATAVVPLRSKEDALNHSVVKCVMDLKGNALYFSRSLIPQNKSGTFDPSYTYYKHLGAYCYTPEFLLNYSSLSPTPLENIENLEQLRVLEHGFRIKVACIEEKITSISVDRPDDIKKVEEWLLHNQSL
ncbi:MAG: 3-deoxy-manno-octulosonate cytidylyltransferase [Chlamydiales bacterium]|nr:3-deoxy-manno-octulosonate cytidylyltransferase [Chlamydiales bacterium]